MEYLKRKVKTIDSSKMLERATRFPLCTLDILEKLYSNLDRTKDTSFPMPRRFFKHLSSESDSRLPDFKYIQALLNYGAYVNAHQGFAVFSAVNADNMELLELLYTKIIDPNLNQGVALKTAVKQNNKRMVEYILEASSDKERFNLPIMSSVKTAALRIAAQG